MIRSIVETQTRRYDYIADCVCVNLQNRERVRSCTIIIKEDLEIED